MGWGKIINPFTKVVWKVKMKNNCQVKAMWPQEMFQKISFRLRSPYLTTVLTHPSLLGRPWTQVCSFIGCYSFFKSNLQSRFPSWVGWGGGNHTHTQNTLSLMSFYFSGLENLIILEVIHYKELLTILWQGQSCTSESSYQRSHNILPEGFDLTKYHMCST